MPASCDTLIVAGLVPSYGAGAFVRADVAIKDGKVVAVGEEASALAAAEVIDAHGLVVSPGFIDVHMHEEDVARDPAFAIGRAMARMGVTTCVCGNCGVSPQPLGALSEWVDAQGGAPTNYVVLAGYNSAREAQGLGFYDVASPEQRIVAQRHVRDEVEAGAWGVSFGLEYHPGIAYEEMRDVVLAVADLDPFVSIHFRRDCEGAVESIREMARLSRDTGCRVQVSHLSSLAAYGYMDEALALIDAEIEDNPLFGFDTYPYEAFSTSIGSAVFDVDWRAKWGVDYDAILVLHGPHAGQRATKEVYEDLRDNDPYQHVVCFALHADEIEAALADRRGLVCSDGGIYDGTGHPRCAGTFPRFLGRYVRERGTMGLLDGLRKITLDAARRIGLDATKGSLEPGKDADLVIFDPETIRDGATFEDPTAPPAGIERVMVAGRTVVRDNDMTGELPGMVLRRNDR